MPNSFAEILSRIHRLVPVAATQGVYPLEVGCCRSLRRQVRTLKSSRLLSQPPGMRRLVVGPCLGRPPSWPPSAWLGVRPDRDGFGQWYNNFSNRPHPLVQNRGTILMGIVLWRVTENPKIAILGVWPTSDFPKNGYDLDIRPSGGNSGWHGWMRRQKLV